MSNAKFPNSNSPAIDHAAEMSLDELEHYWETLRSSEMPGSDAFNSAERSRSVSVIPPLRRLAGLLHGAARSLQTATDRPEAGTTDSLVARPDRALAERRIETSSSEEARFEVLELVGRGGFARVYRARDRKLDRLVALKVLHTHHLGGAFGLERFQREARTAAQLQHPGLVPVYDVTEFRGHPAIVSEFVPGRTLRRWLDEQLASGRTCDPRFAAKLIAHVADALAHAHDAGVVHRDLKPANVLVCDDTQLPRVVDFGLAARDDGDATMTETGEILGTWSYMSPEQAAGRSRDVDGRCDLYALGVILYEMLCGTAPFHGSRVSVQHQILNEEPRPLREHVRDLPADLETICLRCLRKSPGHRYAGTRELAADLRRFLAGEPILGRPVSWREKWLQWARCRPRTALATGLSAAFVIVLIAVSAIYNVVLGKALEDARLQREQAQGNLRKLIESVRELYVEVSEDDLLNAPHMDSLRKRLLRRAIDQHREILQELPGDAESLAESGRALELMANLSQHIDEPAQAADFYFEARRRFEELARIRPDDRVAARQAIRMMAGEGLNRLASGESTRALSLLEQATTMADARATADPATEGIVETRADCRRDLGMVLSATGRLDDAGKALATAVGLREELLRGNSTSVDHQAALCEALESLALLQEKAGQIEPAKGTFQRAKVAIDRLLELAPQDPRSRRILANWHNNWGDFLSQRGERNEAEHEFRHCRELYAALWADFPQNTGYRTLLAGANRNLANTIRTDDARVEESIAAYQVAIDHLRKLHEQYPAVAEFAGDLAATVASFGDIYLYRAFVARQNEKPEAAEGAFQQAQALYDEGLRVRTELYAREPGVIERARGLAMSHINYGFLEQMRQAPDRAVDHYESALQVLTDALQRSPGDATMQELKTRAEAGLQKSRSPP